mmetsp:Transcript_58092/g.136948  ORF Transcript_58092/g.136948 Transcript_58092/m.136948 type:complete len:251 (-) Transcript_58092:28-780(-)
MPEGQDCSRIASAVGSVSSTTSLSARCTPSTAGRDVWPSWTSTCTTATGPRRSSATSTPRPGRRASDAASPSVAWTANHGSRPTTRTPCCSSRHTSCTRTSTLGAVRRTVRTTPTSSMSRSKREPRVLISVALWSPKCYRNSPSFPHNSYSCLLALTLTARTSVATRSSVPWSTTITSGSPTRSATSCPTQGAKSSACWKVAITSVATQPRSNAPVVVRQWQHSHKYLNRELWPPVCGRTLPHCARSASP